MSTKKKTKTLGQFLIDLTPLLDVIFIFLIVVLTSQDKFQEDTKQNLADSQTTISEMQETVSKAEAQQATINDQMDTYDHLSEYLDIITVYATYTDPAKRKYRDLYVQVNMGELKKFELNPSNSAEQWAACRAYLDKIVEEDCKSKKHVILSKKAINEDRVLYRDDSEINKIYEELIEKYQYPGMYLKGEKGTANE